MKRLLGLLTVTAFLLAIPVSHFVLGKGHVPLNKVQVCHKGETITVSKNALNAHINHGDCQLPACDFANVFNTGDPCDCDDLAPPDSACGETPACPAESCPF